MPILQLPSGVEAADQLMCIICTQPVSLADATLGSFYADDRQAFVHESHRAERIRWLLCWLKFENEQRKLMLRATAEQASEALDA